MHAYIKPGPSLQWKSSFGVPYSPRESQFFEMGIKVAQKGPLILNERSTAETGRGALRIMLAERGVTPRLPPPPPPPPLLLRSRASEEDW